jgi:hypothetical protein
VEECELLQAGCCMPSTSQTRRSRRVIIGLLHFARGKSRQMVNGSGQGVAEFVGVRKRGMIPDCTPRRPLADASRFPGFLTGMLPAI